MIRKLTLAVSTALLNVGMALALPTTLTVNKEIFLVSDGTSPSQVGLGVLVRYKVNIRNSGDPSSVIKLDDPLPPEFVPIGAAAVTCHVISLSTCPTVTSLPVSGIVVQTNGELEIWIDGYFKAPPSKPNIAVASPTQGCPSTVSDYLTAVEKAKTDAALAASLKACSNYSQIDITVPLAAVPVDLKVTKTATPKTGGLPATIKWDIKVENLSPQDIFLGQILTLKDNMFNTGNLAFSWTAGPVTCTSSQADCPELPAIASGTLAASNGTQLFSTKFEGGNTANDFGFMKGVVGTSPGGSFTLSFELTFTTGATCVKGDAKVQNVAFVELTSGSATVGDLNPNNNTGFDTATLAPPANLPACPPDPGVKKEQFNPITGNWESPSTQKVAWGSSVKYRITVTNPGTVVLTDVPVLDEISEEAGTPPFTATLTSGPACTSGCTGLNKVVPHTPAVNYPNSSVRYALWSAEIPSLGTTPAVIEFEVTYQTTCETDARPDLIHNRATSGGSASEIVTMMAENPACVLKVTKTKTPPGPIVFDQPAKYDVFYSNDSAVALSLLTRDALNILSNRYGTVPVDFTRVCDVPKGTVTPLPSSGSGSSGVKHESRDWIGLKPIDQVLTFGANSALHCTFTVTPHRPANDNPFCQGADDIANPLLFRNYAYLDLTTFNENDSVKPASSVDALPPLPTFHVESELPKCRKVIIKKNRVGTPPLPDILPGAPFSYIVTVTNLGDDPVSDLQVKDVVLPGLQVQSVSAACTPATACLSGFPSLNKTTNTVDVSFNTLPKGQVVTFTINVTAPSVGGSFPNTALGSFAPVQGANFYFQGDETSLLHGDEQVQVVTTGAATGFLQVCKASSAVNPVTGNFPFTVTIGNSAPISVTVPVGACTAPIQVPAGTATITEGPVSGAGVNAITASGFSPITLTTENRLINSDLPNRTAMVTVVAGDVSTATVAVFTNFKVPSGFLEVCKDAGPGTAISGSFTFTVSGAPNALYTVPAGACTGSIPVQAGSVTVTEVPRGGFQLLDVSTIPFDRLVSKNIPGGSAIVTVVGGDVSTETVAMVFNIPAPGQLKVCKIAGSGIAEGQKFTISANGVSYTVPAGPPSQGGFCVLDGTFPGGTVVTVQESVPSGDEVSSITVNPPDRSSGAPDPVHGTAQVTIGSGFTEVTFTNVARTPPPTGQLTICNIAGPGVTAGTNFTITATGLGSTQTYTVPAGPPSQGGYCIGDNTFPVGTLVSVTEIAPAGTAVTGIAVVPAGRGGTVDVAHGTVPVTIGTGITAVAITNAASLIITTSAVLKGAPGVAYSQTLAASGGTPPYIWRLTDGRLPRGLRLNALTGEIGGVPAGGMIPMSLEFSVTDSSWPSQTASASFTAIDTSQRPSLLRIGASSIRDK